MVGAGSRGWGRLEPGIIRGNNGITQQRTHPPLEAHLEGLPTEKPLFHLVLSPKVDAYLDDSQPSTWPPAPPKDLPPATTLPLAPEGTAFGEDVRWVAGDIPKGGRSR